MSTTDATTAVALTPAQFDSLRVAQLKQTAESLNRAADELERRSEAGDLDDPLCDVAEYARTVRTDLDALGALGYRDADEGGES